MQVFYLTSGFADGFTDDFIQSIKKYYSGCGLLAFIASDFTIPSITDGYCNLFIGMFKAKGITFDEVQIIDNRVSKDEASRLIEKAAVVWLSGGDTLKQIGHIKEYGLIPSLKKRKGVTIGMSAGSINMAKKVVLARDVEDGISELSIYDGLGLVDINIEPHLDTERKDHIKDIIEASRHATIYGLFDNSFIKVIGDLIEFYGPYVKYAKKS